MKRSEIKSLAIEHYDRMIEFAKSLNPEKVDTRSMLQIMDDEIGELWYSSDCNYCENYSYSCVQCPLSRPYELGDPPIAGKDNYCCGGLWGAMDNTYNWDDWLYYAKKIRKYLKRHG